jgi:hypothetical protein
MNPGLGYSTGFRSDKKRILMCAPSGSRLGFAVDGLTSGRGVLFRERDKAKPRHPERKSLKSDLSLSVD